MCSSGWFQPQPTIYVWVSSQLQLLWFRIIIIEKPKSKGEEGKLKLTTWDSLWDIVGIALTCHFPDRANLFGNIVWHSSWRVMSNAWTHFTSSWTFSLECQVGLSLVSALLSLGIQSSEGPSGSCPQASCKPDQFREAILKKDRISHDHNDILQVYKDNGIVLYIPDPGSPVLSSCGLSLGKFHRHSSGRSQLSNSPWWTHCCHQPGLVKIMTKKILTIRFTGSLKLNTSNTTWLAS